MSITHVALGFTGLPDSALDDFTQNIITKFGGGPLAADSPVAMAVLTAANDAFHTAIAAAINGGVVQTATKDNARTVVENLLRLIALYVQGRTNGDPTVVLNAGFNVASTNRAQSQLETPVILAIVNEMSTQLVVRVATVANARAYQARLRIRRDCVSGATADQARLRIRRDCGSGATADRGESAHGRGDLHPGAANGADRSHAGNDLHR